MVRRVSQKKKEKRIMNLQDFSEYDTVALARLIASKKNWLETVPSGDPRRNRMVSEINLLENVYLKLEAHTNWVLSAMNAQFNQAMTHAMQHPLAKEGKLNGFLFYWQLNDSYTRLGRERKPLVSLHSNVEVHFPMMQIITPMGDICTAIEIESTTPNTLQR